VVDVVGREMGCLGTFKGLTIATKTMGQNPGPTGEGVDMISKKLEFGGGELMGKAFVRVMMCAAIRFALPCV
jgi:hypothetical protein